MGIDQVIARPAVFLDRDGVLNHNVLNPETGKFESPKTVAQFRLIVGVIEALRQLQTKGYLLFLVSNQPDYAKGKSTLENLRAIHSHLQAVLRDAHIEFVDFYYCLHHPEGIVPEYSGACTCRKPSPFFIKQAERQYDVDLTRSWMLGDRVTDIECGQAAGVRTVFITGDTPLGLSVARDSGNEQAPDLLTAASYIPAI